MKKSWNTLPTLVTVSVLAAINPAYAQTNEQSEKDIEVASKQIKRKKTSDTELEIIEVTGLRSSLLKASELKRNADSVIDVISAEDVGNFPDENVIESLQRVTGVQVLFGDDGTAGGFQVRGVSDNRIELNGRSVAGGEGNDASRQVNLADFPSELIDSLEVVKSPTAAKTEGALGATINLKTKRPLAVKKAFINVNAKATYGDEADELYPNINVIGTKSWRDTPLGDFGAIVNVTFNDNRRAGDTVRVLSWGNNCPLYQTNDIGLVANKQTLCDESNPEHQTVYRPNNFVLIDNNTQNKKNAVAATFQWAPNDTYSLTLDLLHNSTFNHKINDVFNFYTQKDWYTPYLSEDELDDDGLLYAYSDIQTGYDVDRPTSEGAYNDTVTPATYINSQVAYVNRSTSQLTQTKTDQTTIALSGEIDFDDINIRAEIAHSKADHTRHYVSAGYNRYSGVPDDQTSDQRLRVQDVSVNDTDDAIAIRQSASNLIIDLTDPKAVGLTLTGGFDANDLRYWRLNNFRDDGWTRAPTTSSAKIDVDYYLDWGPLESIKAGLRYARDYMENSSRFRFTECSGKWGNGAYNPDTDYDCQEPRSAVELAEEYGDDINTKHEGFYSRAGSVPSWTAFDLDIFKTDRALWNEISGFNEVGGYAESEAENYVLTEETFAGYVMINLDGDITDNITYRGNFGVRYVATDVTSETNNALDENGDPVAVELSNNYNNFLPSMNIAFAHEDYGLVRLAASRTMVRPGLSKILPIAQLNNFNSCVVYDPTDPHGVYNESVPNPNLTQAEQDHQLAQQIAISGNYSGSTDSCPGIRTGSTKIGNLYLEAQTSDNVDLSFEHYWGKGNMASLAFFYRKVQADAVYRRDVLAVPVDPDTELYGDTTEYPVDYQGSVVSAVPGYELWRVRTAYNGQGTIRKGFEIGYTQWLDFLPGKWNGLGFSANYTYSFGSRPETRFIDSTTEEYLSLADIDNLPIEYAGQAIPTNYLEQLAIFQELADLGGDGPLSNGFELEDPLTLQPINNMSKHSGNFSVFYDKGPWNVRIAANHRSDYFVSGEADVAIYNDGTTRVDFASSYKITPKLRVRFNINNVTKVIQHRYRLNDQITDRSSYGDRVFSLGVSYRFN